MKSTLGLTSPPHHDEDDNDVDDENSVLKLVALID